MKSKQNTFYAEETAPGKEAKKRGTLAVLPTLSSGRRTHRTAMERSHPQRHAAWAAGLQRTADNGARTLRPSAHRTSPWTGSGGAGPPPGDPGAARQGAQRNDGS